VQYADAMCEKGKRSAVKQLLRFADCQVCF
jgi:hypothetical protein